MIAVPQFEMFDVDQVFRGAFGHREFKTPLAPRFDGFDGLEFFEHLDAGLRLTGLRRFVAEALDEGGQVTRFAFVSFGGGVLQLDFLKTLHFVKRIIAAVAFEFPVFNGPGDVCRAIEKFPVVADDDDGAAHAL